MLLHSIFFIIISIGSLGVLQGMDIASAIRVPSPQSSPTNLSPQGSPGSQSLFDRLLKAIERQEINTIDRLLTHDDGQLVNQATSEGKTPLMIAVPFDEHGAVCKKLIEHSADVSWQNKHGYSALHVAAEKSNLSACKLFIKTLKLLKKIKKFDYCLDAKTDKGWTPLHLAAMVGDIHIAAYLLKKGAQANIRCNNGLLALDYAVLNANIDLCLILHQYTKQDALDSDYPTPLERLEALRKSGSFRHNSSLNTIQSILTGKYGQDRDGAPALGE